ncbi:Tm-1-like ATP-binding domain-containing protein [Devosia sp.]|uniref:Tm-1-like ATP-binding domain-containing protein n=1 Tax=Devosia sp. TaxID=1871048 RepID=UPI003F6E5F9E
MPAIALIVSLDTKAEEARYLSDEIRAAGFDVQVVDFGTGPPGFLADVAASEIAALGGVPLSELAAERDRARLIDTMMRGAAAWAARAHADGALAGVISVGGSGGTAVGTAAMRALPFGVPKVMVSTVAASDVKSYVGTRDITMMNSVVDFAGLNPISEPVLRNAAAAVAAMARAQSVPRQRPAQRLIAATQFGVTTPAVEQAHALLAKAGYTLVPFHATGIGGQTMEALIADGLFEAVLDLTTTEWADEIAGGNLSAGPDRLGAAARAGIPQVIAPGALDMANFFGVPVPERHAGRLIHQHNANVALMRTTPAENAEIGRRIADQLNRATGPVVVLFPLRGVSALDAEGQPFFDPAADQALLAALRQHLLPQVRLVPLDLHINDAAFAEAAVAELLSLLEQHKKRRHA